MPTGRHYEQLAARGKRTRPETGAAAAAAALAAPIPVASPSGAAARAIGGSDTPAVLYARQVEIDLGELPVSLGRVTFTDDTVTARSLIFPCAAYAPATDKDLDEVEMDAVLIQAGPDGDGAVRMLLRSSDGSYLAGKFIVNYLVA